MEKCFKYHEFSGSAKSIVPAAKSERRLTLIRDVNNWTKPRDVTARDPPALLPPAATRSSLPLEGPCPIFTHTQAERLMHQEKSVKYSPVTNPTDFLAVEKG